MYADLMKAPFTASGRSRMTESMNTVKLSTRASVSKEDLPNWPWMMAVRSVRNSSRAGLGLLDDPGQVPGGDQGASARIGHQSAAAQDTTQPAYLGHYLRDRQSHVEFDPTTFHLSDQVVVANIVGAGLACDVGCFPVSKHQHPHLFTQTVGEHSDTANLLLSVAHVGVSAEMDLYGLVKLGGGQFLHQVDGFTRLVNTILRKHARQRRCSGGCVWAFSILPSSVSRAGCAGGVSRLRP